MSTIVLREAERYVRTTRRLYQQHFSFPGNQPLDPDHSAAEYDRQRARFNPRELTALWPFLNLNGSQVVLSLGCGLGVREGFIAEHARLIVGLELNYTSVLTALCKARELGLPMAFATGDIVHLPFADGCADVMVDFAVSEHVYDLLGWMREILRVLKPGGVWLSNTANYCGLLNPSFRQGALREPWWHRLLAAPAIALRYLRGLAGHYTQEIPGLERRYGRFHGLVPGLVHHIDPDDLNAINPWEMRRLARAVGFVQVEAFGFLSQRTVVHRAVYHLLRKDPFLFMSTATLLVARKAR